MLETIITTSQAIRLALAASWLASLLAIGMLAVVVYLLNEWRRDLDGLKCYLEAQGITDKEKPTRDDIKEALSR